MMTIPLEFTSTDLVDESKLRMERYKEKKKLRKMMMRRRGLTRLFDSSEDQLQDPRTPPPPLSPISNSNDALGEGFSKFSYGEGPGDLLRPDQSNYHHYGHLRSPTPPSRKWEGEQEFGTEKERVQRKYSYGEGPEEHLRPNSNHYHHLRSSTTPSRKLECEQEKDIVLSKFTYNGESPGPDHSNCHHLRSPTPPGRKRKGEDELGAVDKEIVQRKLSFADSSGEHTRPNYGHLRSPTPPTRKKKGPSPLTELNGEGDKREKSTQRVSLSAKTCFLFSSSSSTSSKTAFSQLSSSGEAFSSCSCTSPLREKPLPDLPIHEPSNSDDKNSCSVLGAGNRTGEKQQHIDNNNLVVEEIVTLLKASRESSTCPTANMPSPRSQSSLNRGIFSRQTHVHKPPELDSFHQYEDALLRQVDFDKEFDILQKIGEGWFSRVYLSEYMPTGEELVLKMINSQKVKVDEFLQEVRYSVLLSSHKNILRIFDGLVFQARGHFVFAAEYAPLGDLTSNVLSERGVGETATKSITRQIGSALEWVHSKNLCHLDVKLDNILVFKSDFSKVKLCDFGAVRPQGDIVIKKNELLPYCPPELFARHANEYYQVDKMQDVFQFGVVLFFCLFGILPWQKADTKTDPHFGEFYSWRSKKSSAKIPKNFKPLTTKGQKFFKKILDPDPFKRLPIVEVPKFTEDKWIRNKKTHSLSGSLIPPNLIFDLTNGTFSSSNKSNKPKVRQISRSIHSDPLKNNQFLLCDGVSQLTMGSFRSVHSNVEEKNKSLYPLLQAGVETTVDRTQKNSRILKWIQSSNKKNTGGESSEADNTFRQ